MPGQGRAARVKFWGGHYSAELYIAERIICFNTHRGGACCGKIESLITRRGLCISPTKEGRLDGVKDASTAVIGAILTCTVWESISSCPSCMN